MPPNIDPGYSVGLELDALNANMCMPTIIRLINHMEGKFSAVDRTREPPKWMLEMHSKFSQTGTPALARTDFVDTTHPSVLLFILKIMINKEEVFQPYHSFWLQPILEVSIKHLCNQSGFHYFLRDVCLLLLKWRAVPSQNEKEFGLASQFIVCNGCKGLNYVGLFDQTCSFPKQRNCTIKLRNYQITG